MKVLIIVPAHNEEESIVSTIDELRAVVPQLDFLVVNDGSCDRTRAICRSHEYAMLDLAVNLGLTCGFQAGAQYALTHGYDAAIQFDADGQHEAHYIPAMIECMEREAADIVIGSRFVNKKKSLSARMIGSRLISAMIRLTTGTHIADPTSGMRLFNRRSLETFAIKNDFGPEPDSIAYLIRRGAKIAEVQVQMRERTAGESYLNLTRSAQYMLRTCISILVVQWFR